MKNEEIQISDYSDKFLGTDTYENIHKTIPEKIHRGVAIIVFSPKKDELIISERTVQRFGGAYFSFWTFSTFGHVRVGEGIITSATRLLQDDLGISKSEIIPRLIRLYKFPANGTTYYEHLMVYGLRLNSDESVISNRKRIRTIETKEVITGLGMQFDPLLKRSLQNQEGNWVTT